MEPLMDHINNTHQVKKEDGTICNQFKSTIKLEFGTSQEQKDQTNQL